MRDLTGSPLSRQLGQIIDEAQAAARNTETYVDVTFRDEIPED